MRQRSSMGHKSTEYPLLVSLIGFCCSRSLRAQVLLLGNFRFLNRK
jgi:hypothetical protein